jgi:RNA polymerase sigma-70 factor, ECF subfamily
MTPEHRARNVSTEATLFIRAMGATTSRKTIECAYRDYGTQVWRCIYAYSGGRADIADDVVAEAFARALQDPKSVRTLRPWLYRVAFRLATERLREMRRQGVPDPDLDFADSESDSPLASSLGALQLLTAQQRVVVFLFYYADLSIADIARATGFSRVAVRVQLHRSREALRRRYGSAAAMREWSPIGGTDEQELV